MAQGSLGVEGGPARDVAVVGGGFSGALLALKLARARPQDRVHLIERDARAGVGLAYGACAPFHLLNVPVSRMEVGLEPGFAAWLAAQSREGRADLSDALAESGGALADAFVPRALFGRYMEAQVAAGLSPDPSRGLRRVRGEAVRLMEPPARGVVLADGREIEADAVVLATGNMAPGRPPLPDPAGVLEGDRFVPDPWAPGALERLDPAAPVLIVGAGLTMVDVALALDAAGHRGPVTALSRHGWAPSRHRAGGRWAPFLAAAGPRSPREALRVLRRELARAEAAGVPWQRVFDAARPDVARVWRGWDERARRAFLRRGRTLWDVHRHRMAPRIADAFEALRTGGRLTLAAGRVAALQPAPGGVEARVRPRGAGAPSTLGVFAAVVNCTGPASDFARLEAPLYGYMRRRDLLRADALRLGLETQGGALVDASGAPSAWLYAVGPLTRPALWEVTAVPEIRAQVDDLASRLARGAADAAAPSLDDLFADIGAGI